MTSWEILAEELLDAAGKVVFSSGQPGLDVIVEPGCLLARGLSRKAHLTEGTTQGRRGIIPHGQPRGAPPQLQV